MKKSISELIRAKQKRRIETPTSQKPGNEKPKLIPFSLRSLKNRIAKNDFRFLKTIKPEQRMPGHHGSTEEFTLIPTEKPW